MAGKIRHRATSDLQKEQRRDVILAAAYDLFMDVGFFDVSMAMIAKRAGVAKGTIYIYFETKEDIVKGIIDSLLEESKGIENAIMQAFQNASPQEIISLVVDQSQNVYSAVGSQFLGSMPTDHNAAFISVSPKLNDIQIRCRLIEQLFVDTLFDPEEALAVSVLNLLKNNNAPSTSKLVNASSFPLT